VETQALRAHADQTAAADDPKRGVRAARTRGSPHGHRPALWRTIPFMSAATVIEAPLNLEPVSPDSFIADLEPRSPDAQARATELAQRTAVAPGRRIYD
jgi:hypothetical protein